MSKNNQFVEYVTSDLLSAWDATAKAMFGGYGVKIDGLTVAMIVDDVLYFKVDDSNKSDYEKYGKGPFTYQHKSGKAIAMSYYEAPSEVLDDPNLLKEFVDKSLDIARSKQK